MIGVYVTVPAACFRKGLAREYLETEIIPPPATCYGFLLSLVGETNRLKHMGVRVTPMLLSEPECSVVLRKRWRVKEDNYWVDPNGQVHIVSRTKKAREKFEIWVRDQGWPKPNYSYGLGCGSNSCPDYQQILTGIELIIWLDSSEDANQDNPLEKRVQEAQDPLTRNGIKRFGGLSLGESTHLVDQVSLYGGKLKECLRPSKIRLYKLNDQGLLGLPVWVDHVGSAGTVHVVGELVEIDAIQPPEIAEMPQIVSSRTM
ncbi:MAG: type I-MYXAN CRISPR-associated protein Cas5/Cmx5/DevS [Candidatus Omnitrophica bacterium]|nr:type I-MYXAN CRISPR-associated protein Cas5/Cmx5/DevS [Candidatus Omnitrophota bacterium]